VRHTLALSSGLLLFAKFHLSLRLVLLKVLHQLVLMALHQVNDLLLLRIVDRGSEEGGTDVVSEVCGTLEVGDKFLVPLAVHRDAVAIELVHGLARSLSCHHVLADQGLVVRVRVRDWLGELRIALEVDRFRAVDSVQRRLEAAWEHHAPEVGRQTLLDFGSAVIVVLASQVRIERPDNVAMRVRSVLRSPCLVDEVVLPRSEITPSSVRSCELTRPGICVVWPQ